MATRLRASAAERWMNCPGSVRLIERYPRAETSSPAAQEGTVAHDIAAAKLLNKRLLPRFGDDILVEGGKVTYTEEMDLAIKVYVDYCNIIGKGCYTAVEAPLPQLTRIDRDIGGTADFIAANSTTGILTVVDFKYGSGVFVSEVDNKQLKLYALGALMYVNALQLTKAGFQIKKVRTVIVQPRIGEALSEQIRAYEFPAAELLDFAADVQDAADATRKKDPAVNAGPWCRKTFCPVAAQCPELEKKQAMIVAAQFDPAADIPAAQLGRLLDAADFAEQRVKAIRELAYQRAAAGEEIPGYKLVDKRPTRRWVHSDDRTAKLLRDLYNIEPYEYRLRTPASAEKAMSAAEKKKFKQSNLFASVSSGATLVKGTDPRKPVSKIVEPEEFAKIAGPVAKPETEDPPSEFTIV